MKSRLLLLSVLVLVTTLAIPAGGTAGPTANARFRTVTKSVVNPTAITIAESGAASPYPSIIRVSGFRQGTLLDVNLTLHGFEHTWPDDVDVLLVHAGTNRTIMSDVGGSLDVNNITIRLDDEASNGLLPDSGQLTAGAFQPTNAAPADTFAFPAPDPASANTSLAGFDTLNARGAWKLFVVDEVPSADSGKFAGGWTVTIRAAVPQ